MIRSVGPILELYVNQFRQCALIGYCGPIFVYTYSTIPNSPDDTATTMVHQAARPNTTNMIIIIALE